MVTKQNLGIDVSKDHFCVCFSWLDHQGSIKIKGSRKFANTPKEFEALRLWITGKRLEDLEVHVTMEATGVYYEPLAYFLHEQGFIVHVELPGKTAAYFKSLNIKTRNDRQDAKVLAQLGLERNLRRWKPMSNQMRHIKKLSRQRVQLLKHKTRIGNQLHAEQHSHQPNKTIVRLYTQQQKLAERQIQQLEQHILQLAKADQELWRKVEQIDQIKGVGVLTILTVIVENNGFELITNRAQLVSYCGYDVVEKQSGTSVNGQRRISKKGNRYVRRALFFPAMSVVKYEPVFKQLYDRVFQSTHCKMKAYVAVQRKLLILIYTLFKKDLAYDSIYHFESVQQNSRQDTLPAYTG